MNDHEHNLWRTPTGDLRCVCGWPFAPEPTDAEQAEIDRFGIFASSGSEEPES